MPPIQLTGPLIRPELMSKVLVLNATHEPLGVVPGVRAVVLIMNGKAISLEDRGSCVHAAAITIALPAVVRLTRYVRVPYRPLAAVSRAGVLRRDHRRCAYCGERGDTIDHVVPRSRGGQHSWDNCVACCQRCNTRKANLTLAELGWELHVTPGAPSRVGGRDTVLGDHDDPIWVRWLACA